MKQKHLILTVVLILAAALALGLVLSQHNSGAALDGSGSLQAPGVQPSDGVYSGSGGSTGTAGLPSSEGAAGTSGGSQSGSGSGADSQSVAQTAFGSAGGPDAQPSGEAAADTHIHTFTAEETVAPTSDTSGYTHYVCPDCGFSYDGDPVADLTLQQRINRQALSPTSTGIDTLDQTVSAILSEIIPQGASNYETLDAIYDYLLNEFSHGGGSVDVSQVMSFSDGKVFKNASELVISYEAYQMLTEKQGVSDQYAAAFMVLTRAAGFESYVVNGSLNGSSHVWNNVRIDGTLYAFDAYTATAPQFAADDESLSGYAYQDRSSTIAAQTGFQDSDGFTVRLTLADDSGSKTAEYDWNADKMGSDAASFMVNTISVQAEGAVSYKLEIVSTSGSFLLKDETGTASGQSISGTLSPGSGYYTLQAEETDSMMRFDIRIDN